MSKFACNRTTWIVLIVLACLIIVLAAPSPVLPATACPLGSAEPCGVPDISLVPQSLIDEAGGLAVTLFGNNAQKCRDFTSQLLGMYLMAKDAEVVIINNSGGWGWSSIVDAPHGEGFIRGADAELSGLGYDVLWLEYFRTPKTLNGCISEILFGLGLYPSKAQDLALRVNFLTRHLPDVKIILNGESNGCTLCSDTMHLLKGNDRVYSIEMGPPVLNHNITSGCSLVLRTNGFIPDAFSEGDFISIFRTNIETLLGISPQYPGNILLYVGAPGHDYAWEYPRVGPVISAFLENCLGKNS